MIVFKALVGKLKDLGRREKEASDAEYPSRINLSLDSSFRYDYDMMKWEQITSNYSLAQINEITRTVLDGFNLNLNLEYEHAKNWWNKRLPVLNDYQLYYQEMFNLYRYIEMHGGTEKVDYKDYRPLFMERLYPRMEITPFDIHRPQDMIAQMNRSDPYGKNRPETIVYDNRDLLLRFETLQGLLSSPETDYALEHMVPLLTKLHFVPVVAAKIKPALTKENNWPADLIQSAALAEQLRANNLISDPAAVAEMFVRLVSREKNPQVLRQALITLSPLFNSSLISPERQNELKDGLIKAAAPLWRQDLSARIASFSALVNQNVFSADMVMQNKLLESFIPVIEAVPDAHLRSEYYMHFLRKKKSH